MVKLLYQPFEDYSEKKLLGFGIVLTLLFSFLAYVFNARFDGVIDLHFVGQIELYQPFLDNFINIACLVLFLYSAGKYINRRTRFIDILTTSIVARVPYYALVFFNINGFMNGITEKLTNSVLEGLEPLEPSNVVIVLIFSLFVFAFLNWYIILLYNEFKVASNAKGILPVTLFCLGVVLAEAASKYMIYLINY